MLPPAAASLDEADAAIELWEHYSHKTLDPSQRLVVQVMMAQAESGRWAAATTGREMARQNGKGDEVEVVELWGLVQRSEAILHTVHDAVLLASQAQQRMLGVLERHQDLRRRVKRKWLGTGQQMIEMRNGGCIWYRTRTGGGGRGVDDIDRLVVDEAQHATEEHLAAVAPTLLANDNPQMNAAGTAGLAGKSDWWWMVRKRALSSDPGAFGYVGHTAERVSLDEDGKVVQEPVDVEDRSLWLDANPGVAQGRGQGMDFLEEQLRRLGPESFAREHLSVWDPPPDADGTEWVLPEEQWIDSVDDDTTVGNPPSIALAVADDRSWSAFGSAGVSVNRESGEPLEGRLQVELVEYREGTEWVVPFAKLLTMAHRSKLAVAKGSPAASLVEELTTEGVEVEVVSLEDLAKFCGQLFDATVAGRLKHRDQSALTVAVRGAVKRPVGEAYAWSQRKSEVDISPLVAVTLAAGQHALGVLDVAGSVW